MFLFIFLFVSLFFSFILLRLFLVWGWHRIVVFRKSDHFFEPLLFQAKGIEIIANIEMDEQQLTYKLAKDVSMNFLYVVLHIVLTYLIGTWV